MELRFLVGGLENRELVLDHRSGPSIITGSLNVEAGGVRGHCAAEGQGLGADPVQRFRKEHRAADTSFPPRETPVGFPRVECKRICVFSVNLLQQQKGNSCDTIINSVK